jgi:hypothetical protein
MRDNIGKPTISFGGNKLSFTQLRNYAKQILCFLNFCYLKAKNIRNHQIFG